MRDLAAAMAPRIVVDHAIQLFVGAVDDAAADPGAGLLGNEIVPGHGNRGVAGTEGPVLEEDVCELRHHRAFEPEVEVRNPVSARAFVEIPVGNVHSAGKADPMVHHQHFAVVAQVDVDRGGQQPGRQEASVPHPLLPKHAARVGPGVVLADSVDDYPHIHIAPPRPIERIEETVTGGVGLKEVALEQNAVAGAIYGGEHRRIGLLAIEKRDDLVASEQGEPGHRFRHAGNAMELVPEIGKRYSSQGLRPIAGLVHVEARRPAGFELARPGGDAVHPEKQVENRTRQGKEETDRDPAERRPWVPLAEKHVSGGTDGHERGQHPDEQGNHAWETATANRGGGECISNNEAPPAKALAIIIRGRAGGKTRRGRRAAPRAPWLRPARRRDRREARASARRRGRAPFLRVPRIRPPCTKAVRSAM